MPIADVLDQGAFDLQRVLEREPEFLEEHEHEHNDDIASMSFEVSRPIDPEKFNAWISALLAEKGQDLLRTKGILAYAERGPALRLPGRAHDRRRRLHRPVGAGRGARARSWCSSAAT